jgi:hypothetical protein
VISELVPLEHEKECVQVSRIGHTGIHYVTRRSHRMQKHKFNITCPDALFVESASIPPEHEKYCVNVSRYEHTKMHYVTNRSHRMQKHKVGVT